MTTSFPPAIYFPVRDEPLKMSPGLFRLGQDFGNGERDGLIFQRDREAAEYRKEKERIFRVFPHRFSIIEDPSSQALLSTVRAWMGLQLKEEFSAQDGADFRAISLEIQEDFAVLQLHPDGRDRMVLLSVCFPSGWRPEKLIGQSFALTHQPIPDFEGISRKQQQIVEAMVERGPYVRFVWTVTADARLDHHPSDSPRDAWQETSEGILRVERQLTVPFPDQRGSLFLIRTYRYPLSELDVHQKATLAGALRKMPASILAYKGLTGSLPLVLSRLG